jgi:hypothetical protein
MVIDLSGMFEAKSGHEQEMATLILLHSNPLHFVARSSSPWKVSPNVNGIERKKGRKEK